ncbi:MAG: glycogen debranching N-terminal domain-containing protein [Actinomycetota bacterium]
MAWNTTTAAGVGTGAVTIVEGSSFCISGPDGNMAASAPHGIFHLDTRIISAWNITAADHDLETLDLETLAAHTPDPYRAVFVGRLHQPGATVESPLVLRRERDVGAGLREVITVDNHGRQPARLKLRLAVDADFADLFDVKVGREGAPVTVERTVDDEGLVLAASRAGVRRGVVIHATAGEARDDGLHFNVEVPARGSWSVSVIATPHLDGRRPAEPFLHTVPPGYSGSRARRARWAQHVPRLDVDDEDVEEVLEQSHEDLGSLRIFDDTHPGRVTVAAGAPWFMALFGRDSLVTSLMSIPVDRALAIGTLQTLADLQGTEANPATEEEPGRILHEVRFGAAASLALGGGRVYYGTADATPLFVLLLGELSRWVEDGANLEPLLPHADRALEWIERYGDRDSDGLVEYARQSEAGLVNQGWKDSWDGITFADGRLAEAPIALCEVQGYVFAAFRARARLARRFGDEEDARHWADRATALRRTFNERFWLPDRGYYALALDGDKRPVDALASNMGHCLWTGIVDEDRAPLVAARLMSRELFSGWGVRTLATNMGAYNPVSYHNGSVWPHDNALIAAGLMRYGFVPEARRIAVALFDAAHRFGGRLPELFCGFGRDEYEVPIPYPTSCSPQAWASAAPVHLMRTLLRLEPALDRGELCLSPVLPDEFGTLRVENLLLADSRVSLTVTGDDVAVSGLPEDVRLRLECHDPDSEG